MRRTVSILVLTTAIVYHGVGVLVYGAIFVMAGYSITIGKYHFQDGLSDSTIDTFVAVYVGVLTAWWIALLYLIRKRRGRRSSVSRFKIWSGRQALDAIIFSIPIWGMIRVWRLYFRKERAN